MKQHSVVIIHKVAEHDKLYTTWWRDKDGQSQKRFVQLSYKLMNYDYYYYYTTTTTTTTTSTTTTPA